jgi:hypothetical protein
VSARWDFFVLGALKCCYFFFSIELVIAPYLFSLTFFLVSPGAL